MILFFENPDVIAERVAEQLGCTPEQAIERMQFFDQIAIYDFCIGNEIPKEMRN